MKTARLVPVPATDGSIRPPGSKSITNRALVCAALARGTSRLTGVLDSEDTAVMIEAWKHLGLMIQHNRELCQIDIAGCGGLLPVNQAKLFVANSGTTIRFLTAALAACPGRFELDGVARMRQRPIGDLLEALKQLGANVQSLNADNSACPPVLIQSTGLQGGLAKVAGNISSQFLSGLMMAAPMAQTPVTLEVLGDLVSVPYVAMTASVMQSFGANISGSGSGPYHIDTQYKYVGASYQIEPDASAASYFWAAAAISGGRVLVEGLNRQSLQGDVRFCEVLRQMGCRVTYTTDGTELIAGDALHGIDVNMADISDTVQTLAAVALFAKGSTTVRGVAHNRVKETDRISDLATELRRLGAKVEEFEDGLTIHPPGKVNPCSINTYNDHRMAMSLALVGLRVPGIEVRDPDCTSKTYPGYWQDLAKFTRSTIAVS